MTSRKNVFIDFCLFPSLVWRTGFLCVNNIAACKVEKSANIWETKMLDFTLWFFPYLVQNKLYARLTYPLWFFQIFSKILEKKKMLDLPLVIFSITGPNLSKIMLELPPRFFFSIICQNLKKIMLDLLPLMIFLFFAKIWENHAGLALCDFVQCFAKIWGKNYYYFFFSIFWSKFEEKKP